MVTILQLKQELTYFLRNSDVLTTTQRGVTTQQDTGTFSAANSHTLAVSLSKNIRSVVVASVTLLAGRDYSFNVLTGVINFTSPQTGAYVIDYDTGSSDRIWWDYPQPNLTLDNFPRISVDIILGTSKEIALGGTTTQSTYDVQISCYDKEQIEVEEIISRVHAAIRGYKKDFYYIPFLTPTSTGPLLVSEWGEGKVVQRNQDAQIQFVMEGTS